MYSLAVNAEGTSAVVSTAWEGEKAPVYLWNISANTHTVLCTNDVESFAFSPDGKWLASGNASGHLELWDLRIPEPSQPFLRWRAHYRELYALAFSPDSARLATGGSDQRIVIWRAGSTNIVGQLTGHGGMIDSVSFSADGKRLVSASRDNTAKIWDLGACLSAEEGRRPRLPTAALPVRVDSSGTGLFTLEEDQNRVSHWGLQSGERLWTFESRNVADAGCPSLFFFLKQQVALGFSTNRVLHMWELDSGRLVRSVPLPVSGLEPPMISMDKRWLVGCPGWPRGVWLFDLQEGKAVPGFGFDRWVYTWVADFSPDGHLLACTSGYPNSGIHIWDLQSRKEVAVCRGQPVDCYALRFSPDSKVLASGDWGGNVLLWSAETGKPLWPALKGHDAVFSCCFSTDSRTLITGDPNANLRFWSVASGQEMLSISDAFPFAQDLMVQKGFLYRGQVEVNPTPDLLVWQELHRELRLISLPTLSDIDAGIVREQENLSRVGHEKASRERELAQREADRLAAVARDSGAIKEWLVLGPIPLAPGQNEIDLLDAELLPNEAGLRPRAGERVSIGGTELTWRLVRQADYTLNFNKLVGAAEHAAVYAVCYLSVPSPCSALKMLVGSDDQAKVYLNGRQIYSQTAVRELVPDKDIASGVNLQTGTNVLLFKVLNVSGSWGGSVRFTDSTGTPVSGLSVQVSPP
jgi:WD40 repeat protein